MTALTTFIIPTIGRDSLDKAVETLLAQSDPDWEAILIYDGVPPRKDYMDSRISTIVLKKKVGVQRESEEEGIHNYAGEVRNVGIDHVKTPWISFLDDDDELTPDYVEILRKESSLKPQADICLFRMFLKENGVILPIPGTTAVKMGQIGIAFSVRTEFIHKNKIRFSNHNEEDYYFIVECGNHKAIARMSEDVVYVVG